MIFVIQLATNNLRRQEIKTKDLFNCTVVGTIQSTIIAFGWNLYSLSVIWLKTPFSNLQKLISHIGSLLTSTVAILYLQSLMNIYWISYMGKVSLFIPQVDVGKVHKSSACL